MRKLLISLSVVGVIIVGLVVLAHFGLSLSGIIGALQTHVAAKPVATGLIFFAVYVISTAVSIPGAALLTLGAGALFGLSWGVVIVSFASSMGATCAFLVARALLQQTVQARFGQQLSAINAGIAKEGAYYLFTLRLVPLFPFFLINLLMGLSPIKTGQFYWVSQLGMLPATIIYVNAGAQAADINAVQDLLSPAVLASFIALGLFPLLAKRGLAWWQQTP